MLHKLQVSKCNGNKNNKTNIYKSLFYNLIIQSTNLTISSKSEINIFNLFSLHHSLPFVLWLIFLHLLSW